MNKYQPVKEKKPITINLTTPVKYPIKNKTSKVDKVIDNAIETIDKGNIIFNTPETLVVNESTTITLIISLKDTIQELKEKLETEDP
ncbi:MAG: hypothetical protein ACR2NW_10715, partial [Thermodesulfobacteriota bacterium]